MMLMKREGEKTRQESIRRLRATCLLYIGSRAHNLSNPKVIDMGQD